MTFLLGSVLVVIKWMSDARRALIKEAEVDKSIRTSQNYDLAMKIAALEAQARELYKDLSAAQAHFRTFAKRKS